jgi:hypothetical protein
MLLSNVGDRGARLLSAVAAALHEWDFGRGWWGMIRIDLPYAVLAANHTGNLGGMSSLRCRIAKHPRSVEDPPRSRRLDA